MEFSKKNLTYIIIFIFILLSLIHLVNIKDNYKDNDNNSSIIKENFITLTEDQIFAPDADAIIPSTDLVQFGELGTSKAANNLSQIINNMTTNNTENATKINTLSKTIVNLSSNINVLESTVKTLKINNKLDLDNIRVGKINIGVEGSPLKNTITCPEPMFISTTGDLTLETTTNVNIKGSLKSSGGIGAINGLSMTGSGNDGTGGAITIINTDKSDPKQAYTWAIYNMNNYGKDYTGGPGKPGSGLSFWRYAKDKACTGGGMCDRHMTLNDDGTTFFGSSVSIDGMQELAGPNSTTRITAQGIIFGGANNGREANSAQISAGKHIANSLNIIGMSTGTDYNTRKIDMWAEGGLTVYGRLTASSVNSTNVLSMTGSGGGGTGGAITIINTDKSDPKQAYTWAIYNMNNYGKDYTGGPGKPGSGLSFWRYAKDKACVGGMCDRHMTLNDDGTTFFGSSVIIDGIQELAGPNSCTRITAQGIIFGGANNGREANSAQISAGKHIANSLNIVGMSTGTDYNTRKIDMWAEGGLNVYGGLTTNGNISTSGTLVLTKSQNYIDGGEWVNFKANRVHLQSTVDDIYLMSKGSVIILKNDYWKGSGNLYVMGNLTYDGAFGKSDRRLKENIKNISENDKDKVLQLVPKTYNMIDDEKKSKRFGLIAQEVEELYPELVSTDDKGMKSMNYMELIPLLLEQIKELKKTIPNQETLNIDGAILTKSDILKLKKLIM